MSFSEAAPPPSMATPASWRHRPPPSLLFQPPSLFIPLQQQQQPFHIGQTESEEDFASPSSFSRFRPLAEAASASSSEAALSEGGEANRRTMMDSGETQHQSPIQGEGGSGHADSSNPRYKTEICRNFRERSRCVYGDNCQFAHGRRELREVVRNTKYKTKPCQKYWITGYCVYGPRCNFLHDEKGAQPPQAFANI